MVQFVHPKYGTRIVYFDRMTAQQCEDAMEIYTYCGYTADTGRLFR